MNPIYNTALQKIKNNDLAGALNEISQICQQDTFDIILIELLDKLFANKTASIETLYKTNLKLLEENEHLSKKNFVPISQNPNRCYIVSNNLIYLFIAKDCKFIKVDISSQEQINQITSTITKEYTLHNIFNLLAITNVYKQIPQLRSFGHHIVSYNSKHLNKFYIHYDNIEEFSLLLYMYNFSFLKQLDRMVFLIGDDTKPKTINQAHVIYCKGLNLGDTIGPMIVEWLLERKNIDINKETKKDSPLLAVGSLCGMETEDVTIWGSGFHTMDFIVETFNRKNSKKLDFRAVRGPVTRMIYKSMGYNPPEVYGDPGILMPFLYEGSVTEKKYDVSLIIHCGNKEYEKYKKIPNLHFIDIKTDDYKFFIDELLASKRVISSALHGIILSETYGIPTTFFNSGDYIERAMMKYCDWYHSTNRKDFKIATTIEEAIAMEPEPVPDFKEMQNNLIEAFPYDLWD